MNGEPLYEEWFLDISSIFTVYLPTIQFDEEANCFTVRATVDGSRYMKEIIGEIKVDYRTKPLLVYKMYEIIFNKMQQHFDISKNKINKDRIFVNCLERLFEQMVRNFKLQETYSILLGNVLNPTKREQSNIIKNLEELRLLKQLSILQDYWALQPDTDWIDIQGIQVNDIINEQHGEIVNEINSKFSDDEESLEIAIELIQRLESNGKGNRLKRLTDPENHPAINLYNTESGHYQIIRLGKNKMVDIPISQYREYVRYHEKLDLYIIEDLFHHPKIIFIDNVNQQLRSGKLQYNSMVEQLSFKSDMTYKIY